MKKIFSNSYVRYALALVIVIGVTAFTTRWIFSPSSAPAISNSQTANFVNESFKNDFATMKSKVEGFDTVAGELRTGFASTNERVDSLEKRVKAVEDVAAQAKKETAETPANAKQEAPAPALANTEKAAPAPNPGKTADAGDDLQEGVQNDDRPMMKVASNGPRVIVGANVGINPNYRGRPNGRWSSEDDSQLNEMLARKANQVFGEPMYRNHHKFEGSKRTFQPVPAGCHEKRVHVSGGTMVRVVCD